MKRKVSFLITVIFLSSCASKSQKEIETRKPIFIKTDKAFKLFSNSTLRTRYKTQNLELEKYFNIEAQGLKIDTYYSQILDKNIELLSFKTLTKKTLKDEEYLTIPISAEDNIFCSLLKIKGDLVKHYKNDLFQIAAPKDGEVFENITKSIPSRFGNILYKEYILSFQEGRDWSVHGYKFAILYPKNHPRIKSIGCSFADSGYRQTLKRMITDIVKQL